jgi:DNA-binding PadR family transcriptional regulator
MPPVFAHGQLRLYLLSLLEDGPRHGYELITALSERFGGTYRPSAGTVYPRLARLEEEGLVRRTDAGRKSLYELTDAGRAELEEHRDELVALEHDLADTVRRLAAQVRHEVTGAMAGMKADLAAAAQEARAAAVRVAAVAGEAVQGGASWAGGPPGGGPSGHAPGAAPGSAPGASAAGATAGPAAGATASGAPHPHAAPAGEQDRSDRAEQRRRRADVEAELIRFREEVRAAVRVAEAHGDLPALTVDTVRTVLASARSAITGTLPRR